MNKRLVNLPKPEIAKRKHYVKINKLLAITMERYAEFLQRECIDFGISQGLDILFSTDTALKAWFSDASESLRSLSSLLGW
jgi:hypothetical protein